MIPNSTDLSAAFEAWVDGLSEGWWDDAADAHAFLGSLEEAFAAGWQAALAQGAER